MDTVEVRRQKRMAWRRPFAAALCIGGVAGDASAAVIDDRSFFDAIPHTFLDFETTGDGSPVDLADGDLEIMSFKEYDAFGMRWNGLGTAFWGNPSDPDAEAAITAAGSPNHVVGWSNGRAGMFFPSLTVQSVGFSLFVDTSVHVDPIIIHAARFDGSIIETIEFGSSHFDGMIGDIAFGFVGFTLDEPVSDIVFVQVFDFAIDDLHYSNVPAPGSFAIVLPAFLAMRRRR